MAGHSVWKNMKHRKARSDAKRGKIWSKCARAIIVAARHGGGDVATNLALRYAVDDAKAANMPKDTIQNAIKKGTGELKSDHYEAAIYEGYGPGGVAVIMEILTDKRNRTAGELKLIFQKHGGNLAGAGSVAYLFEPQGQVLVPRVDPRAGEVSEDAVTAAVLDAGAQDVALEGEHWMVRCPMGAFIAVRSAVEAAGLTVESAQLAMAPQTTVACSVEDARAVLALLEAVEEHDDVQKVYSNADIPNSVLAEMA